MTLKQSSLDWPKLPEPQEPNVEEIIAAYMELRSRKDRLKVEYEERAKKISTKMGLLEVWLQNRMSLDKVNSFNTDAGTAYKATTEHASVVDMDALLDFIKTNEAWHLIEKRVSKTGVRSYLDEGEPVPPGVNWYTSTAIHVRKPNER